MFVLLHDLNRLHRRARLPQEEQQASHAAYLDGSVTKDLARFGLVVTAHPERADVLLIAEHATTQALPQIIAAHAAMPSPRIVATLGLDTDTQFAKDLEGAVAVTMHIRQRDAEQVIDDLRPLLLAQRRQPRPHAQPAPMGG